MKKISRRYFNLIFSTLVAVLMSLFMSFVLTAINIGFPSYFILAWLKSLGIGFAVALPVSLLVIPLVKRFIDPWFRQDS